GDVRDRPHRVSAVALADAERTHAHPEPAALPALMARDPHLLLLPLAFARSLEQAEHRFRDIGIADEDALDRTHVLRAGRAREREISSIGIDDMTALVGDGEPVEGMIGDAAHHGIVGL